MATKKAKSSKRRAPRRGYALPEGIPGDHFEFYRAADGWRWRAWAANGNKLGDGGQGYTRLGDCIAGLEALLGLRAYVVRRGVKRVVLQGGALSVSYSATA